MLMLSLLGKVWYSPCSAWQRCKSGSFVIESQSLSGKSVVGCLIVYEKTKLIRAEMFPFPSSQMLSVQSSFKRDNVWLSSFPFLLRISSPLERSPWDTREICKLSGLCKHGLETLAATPTDACYLASLCTPALYPQQGVSYVCVSILLTQCNSGVSLEAQIPAACGKVLHGPHCGLYRQAFQFPVIDFTEWSDHRVPVLNLRGILPKCFQLHHAWSPLFPARLEFPDSFLTFFSTMTWYRNVHAQCAYDHGNSPKESRQLKKQSFGIAWVEDSWVPFRTSNVLWGTH